MESKEQQALQKLSEVDFELLLLEDTLKGEDGDTITSVRGKLEEVRQILAKPEERRTTHHNILVIGDIHGSGVWKRVMEHYITSHGDPDLIIFIGDYFDSEDIGVHKEFKNFEEILELRRKNPQQVVLLVGNHDFHYMPWAVARAIQYTGFRRSKIYRATPELNKALQRGHLQACYIHKNMIFTHAGISQVWLDNHNLTISQDEINKAFVETPHIFHFLDDPKKERIPRPSGSNVWQSPMWIRPKALKTVLPEGYTQIVGHSHHEDIREYAAGALIVCDALPYEYISIKDGNVIKHKLP